MVRVCNLVSGTAGDPLNVRLPCLMWCAVRHHLLYSHYTHRCEVQVKVQRSGKGEEVSVVPCVCATFDLFSHRSMTWIETSTKFVPNTNPNYSRKPDVRLTPHTHSNAHTHTHTHTRTLTRTHTRTHTHRSPLHLTCLMIFRGTPHSTHWRNRTV